jgi:ectoine hydroxylase-related dioxygenase (phytanoyl-CoA dioxygenase family)
MLKGVKDMNASATILGKRKKTHVLHATTEEDARYFLGKLAERMTRCQEFAVPLLESVQQYSDIVGQLHQDGFVILRNHFPTDLIQKIRTQVEGIVRTREGLAPIRAHSQETPQDLMEGTYQYFNDHFRQERHNHLEDLVSSVGVQDPLVAIKDTSKLVFDPGILGIGAAFYGAMPTVTFLKIRYAFGNAFPPADTQLFHVDGGSYRIFKALVYLNDVEEGGGPFCYVRGSHRLKWDGWDHKARYEDAEIENVYGAEAIVRCYAKAGDVLLANTTGIHRGEKPVKQNRGILIVNYCLHPEYGFEHPAIHIKKEDREALSPFRQLAAEHLVEVS